MNIFKRSAPTLQPVTKPKTAEQKQSVQELVAEIHETFFTEVDRLLEQANVTHSLHTDKESVLDKAKRLRSLGFGSTKEVQESTEEEIRLQKLEKENKEKQDLVEAIQYFSQKYPLYKFITEDSVKRICNKYGLVYGPVGNYVATVPDKNLAEIENFKVSNEDQAYFKTYRSPFSRTESTEFISLEQYLDWHKVKNYADGSDRFHIYNDWKSNYRTGKCGFEIAAPAKDFNLEGMEIKDFKVSTKPIEVPDPIVLCPVMHNGKKHYLIVTAWGLEAGDEDVINTKYN